jgi:hypothetical protein
MSRRKLIGLVAAVLVLLAAVDFWRRIYVPRQLETREASSFVPAPVPPPLPAAVIRKDLSAWLPKLQLIAEGSGSEVASGYALTLLAVFDDRTGRFAVLRALPASGGPGQITRVEEGDEISGFKVARVEPLRVVLAGPEGERELRLFKPAAEPVIGAGGVPAPSGSTVAPVPAPGPAVAGGPAPAAVTEAPGQPPAPAPQPSASKAAPAGAKAVATQEVKPGQAFELPASMRGMKVIEAPSEGVVAKPGPPVAAPPPQNP